MTTATSPAQFFETQFGFGKEGTRGTPVAIDTWIPAKTAKPKLARERIDAQGADGDAQKHIVDNPGGAETYSAEVNFPFRPLADYEELLECLAGGTPTGSGTRTYPIANILPGITVEIGTGQDYATLSSIISKGSFSSEVNGPLMCMLEFLGISLSRATSGSTMSVDLSRRAFIHQDVAMTVDGVTLPISRFEWTWDRNVRVYHGDAVAPSALVERRMAVQGSASLIWSEEARDVFAKYVSDTTVAIIATYTSGANIIRFTFNDVKLLDQDWPSLADLDVEDYTLPFEACRDDATDAVVIEMTDV